VFDWTFAALPAVLIGILAHRWKAQSGVVWAVITLMIYFIVWSAWHITLTFDVGLAADLGDTSIAAVSGVLATSLAMFGLWTLRSSKLS
jgi:hypothetical protein